MAHLPSLQTLRAFEAAGRLASYTKAATELGLTHSAVSHRIRELEQRVGKPLFRRDGNTMVLTSAGAELLVQVRQGLSLLEQAFTPPGRQAGGTNAVVVSAVPSLASTWLFERLADFRESHPDVELSLRVSEELADFQRDGVDLGVRLGLGGWPNLNVERLFDEVLCPVCTKAYRDRVGLETPADLAKAVLLRNAWTPWAQWFKAVGLDWPEPSTGPSFDDAILLLRAAMRGDGVALARTRLAGDEVRKGTLVHPFDKSVTDEFSYWVVWPVRRALRPGAAAFRTWILAQAARERG
ncbi:MAG TPA: LysR substrate-binding domain-containing protein [Caulobacterales bacterium]|nr:LysR substrate-binding domain-containing protein [Caulobacterales bacterium]